MAYQRWSHWLKRGKDNSTTKRNQEESKQRTKRRPALEHLEDRTVPTAVLNISAQGVATFTGSAVNNNLTLSLSGGVYTFADQSEAITVTGQGAAGFTGGGTKIVQGPSSSVSGLIFNLGSGQDTFELGSFDAPVAPLSANGGGSVGDNVDVSSQGAGLEVTAGDVSLTGFATISVNNAVTADAGAITLTSSGTIDVNSAVTAARDITLNGQSINVNHPISTLALSTGTTGDISVTATGAIALNDTISTGDASITDMVGSDAATSGSITLVAGKGIQGPGAIVTGNGSISSPGPGGADVITSGSISLTASGTGAGSGIGLSAPSALSTGDATGGSGTLRATVGGITLTSATSIDDGQGGKLGVDFGVAASAQAVTPGTFSATTAASGGVAGEILVSSASQLVLGTITTVGGNVDISTTGANGDIHVTNGVSAGTGSLAIGTAGPSRNLSVDGALVAGAGGISLTATGNISLVATSSVQTTGSFTAQADSDQDGLGSYADAGPVNAASMTLSGAGVLIGGTVTATGLATATSTIGAGGSVANPLTINAGITAPAGIFLTAVGLLGDVLISAPLAAQSGPIQVDAGNNVTDIGAISCGGAFTVTAMETFPNASGGTYSQSGAVQAGSVQIVASQITAGNLTTVTGAASYTTKGGSGMIQLGGVMAGGAVNVSADGTLPSINLTNGMIKTTGGIYLQTGGTNGFITGNFNLQAQLTAGSAGIQVQSTGSFTVGGVSTTGPYTVVADFDNDGIGIFGQNGPVSAGNISATAAGIQIANGLVSSGQVALTCTGANVQQGAGVINISSGGIVAPKGISLSAPMGIISIVGDVLAVSGPIQIQAINSVSLTGNVTAGAAFSVTVLPPYSVGSLGYSQTGLVQAGNVSFIAPAITVNGPLTSTGTVAMTTHGGAGALFTSTITAVGAVSLSASSAGTTTPFVMTVGGAGIVTQGGISLVATGPDAIITGPLGSPGIAPLKAGSAGITIQATGSIIVGTANTTGTFAATADTDSNGLGNYFESGPVTAANINISGAGVQLGGSLTTAGQALVTTTFTSQGFNPSIISVNPGGGISAAKGIFLDASAIGANIQILAALTSTSGPVQAVSSTSIAVGADVTAGGAFTASTNLNPISTNGYTQSGNVQAGNVSITGHNLALTGSLTSKTTVTLAAQGFDGVISTGAITAGGLVSMSSLGSTGAIMLGASPISTSGGIRMVAQGPQGSIAGQQLSPVPGNLKAGAAGIQLLASGFITVGGASTTGAFSASADTNGDGFGVYAQAGQLNANGIIISGAGVTLSAPLTSSAQVAVVSTATANGFGSGLMVNSGAPITSAAGISLVAKSPNQPMVISDALTAKAGPIQIQAIAGVTLSGIVTATSAFNVYAYAGFPTSAVATYVQTAKVTAGSVNIVASGISLTAPISATGSVTLQSIQNSTTGVLVGGGGGITAGGAIALTASGGLAGPVLILDALTSKSGSVSVQALSGISVSANITAAGAASFNAATNPAVLGTFFQNPNGAIKGSSITIGDTSTFLGGTLTSQTGIALNGALTLNNATLTTGAASKTSIASDVASAGTSRIAGSLFLGNKTRTITLNTATDTLTVTGVVSGTPTVGLTEAGAGTLTLQGKNTYTGPTILNGGTLVLTGTQATSSVVVNTGATLAGTGAVSQLMVLGGTVSPGTSTTVGAVTTTGPVTFAPSIANVIPTFTVKINTFTSDVLKAGDSVNLGVGTQGAALNISFLNGATSTTGKKFTIVTSTGLIGNFTYNGTALNDGDTFTVGQVSFKINYAGGSAVLTVV